MAPEHPNLASTRPPGWDDGWERSWACCVADGDVAADAEPARVVRIDKGGITTSRRPGDEQLVVAAKSARRVVVGDVVSLDVAAGRIEAVLDRRTVFERRSPGVSRGQVSVESRAVAANMDHVLVLQPLDPGLNPPRLARELVLAWESGATPIVVLTKADLVSSVAVGAQLDEAHGRALRGAARVVSTSVANALAGH
ncbi:MAG: GTPase RsgA, partial [Actinobacteria bacterium]|nr:GTPase RsgA [Actinomycetota bacterium]